MTNKKTILISLVIVFAFISSKIICQTNQEWQPIFLLITGDNKMDGIEASFQVNSCNGEDVVYVKFINHNPYTVKLEWFDAIFTQGLKWINKEQEKEKKSLVIAANAEVKGECSDNKYKELVVNLKNFGTDKKDVKRYSSSQLMVTSVQ